MKPTPEIRREVVFSVAHRLGFVVVVTESTTPKGFELLNAAGRVVFNASSLESVWIWLGHFLFRPWYECSVTGESVVQ